MTEAIVTESPNRFRIQAMAARAGLKAIKLGGRLNTSYTPKNCREVAEKVSGQKFRARDYDGMILAIDRYLDPGNN